MSAVGILLVILYDILFVFVLLMFVRLVFDYVQMFARSWRPTGIVLVILEIVYSVTDPPIKLVRRFVPPLRLGSVMLDTSFFIVLIVVFVLQNILQRLIASV
ncbi:MAG: YggT family protein [Nocardioides sp.]